MVMLRFYASRESSGPLVTDLKINKMEAKNEPPDRRSGVGRGGVNTVQDEAESKGLRRGLNMPG